MDFSRIALTDEEAAFAARARDFLQTHVTDDVKRRVHDTGESFDETVHLALGAHGWLAAQLTPHAEGGLTRLQRRIFELEKRRARAPYIAWGTTAMVARAVRKFARPELQDEVLPGVCTGRIRLCLGYTEPEGGSDIMTCKTRAVRDGDGSSWVINGAKMFTTGAHISQYVFLITNTSPDAPKRDSLTMFLVPLHLPGIDIHAVRCVDGDRTNLTYYNDVRVPDKYRMGEVNGGWTVLRDPLNAEHGAVDANADGLQDIAVMQQQADMLAQALDDAIARAYRPDRHGRRLADDQSVGYRLGRDYARVEAALSTPNILGRVAIAQALREVSADMMDTLGSAAALPIGAHGSADDGAAEYLFRFAPLVAIYGGTVEVFRNMIAQYVLGLGKPAYAAPAEKNT
ncbi:acyl-CoA dehydrogenase family protein [Mycobacterium sp. 852002-51057_SCH5723018]|uniref:acyl-CoA dehydrogenase family protein n=1 Tax=Mycobacterium sp. 852002-51057_SCH5723018 TaxID=1834094 RepID=UPI000802248F|nr:acyl-CoA dehydrogenase family protein [Mycobacterium sp. 852002-51057_SCH5723018]OBG30263.1 acyl-CoA dehydrogenase [Mycobacterium sp. 852002-51057_SCH5723018]